jgi:hypothetical protein
MCFSKKSSLLTFIIGIIGSLLLIFYGNKKYVKENLIAGLYFIFVSFMQFFDYLIWSDIYNKDGINHYSTLLAPLFNHSQPTFLFILCESIYKKYNIFNFILNFIYFIYVIVKYIQFISYKNNLITSKKYGHLYWKWKENFNYYFYFFILTLNIFVYMPLFYGIIFFLLGLFTLLIAFKYFYNNTGELWCYIASFVPFIILMTSYFI